MLDRIKQLSTLALGLAIFLALLAIPVLFFMGGLWAAKHLLEPLIAIGWIAFGIDLILLFLALVPAARGFSGLVIFLSSYIFGLVTWLLGFILAYALWGLWAVILGVLLFGGGVVPVALLATIFKGMWEAFFTLIALTVLTFGSRMGGLAITISGETTYQT